MATKLLIPYHHMFQTPLLITLPATPYVPAPPMRLPARARATRAPDMPPPATAHSPGPLDLRTMKAPTAVTPPRYKTIVATAT